MFSLHCDLYESEQIYPNKIISNHFVRIPKSGEVTNKKEHDRKQPKRTLFPESNISSIISVLNFILIVVNFKTNVFTLIMLNIGLLHTLIKF